MSIRRSARSRTSSPPSSVTRGSSPPSSGPQPLAPIERNFGGTAFRALRAQVDPLLVDMRERFRQDDVVTRDEREGDRFLLFLSGPRRPTPRSARRTSGARRAVEEFLNPRVGRLTLPYLKERRPRRRLRALSSGAPSRAPSAGPALVDDAVACRTCGRGCTSASRRERCWRSSRTGGLDRFQPIVELGPGRAMGYEASRGAPRGSDLELPVVLFGRAAATASPRSSSARAGARPSSTGGCSASRAGSS